ncbi:hypothetical protein Tco_0189460 [Tanacetum coccineum]
MKCLFTLILSSASSSQEEHIIAACSLLLDLFTIFASFGACSNVMLFCFMAVHAHSPTSEFHFLLEIALGVFTLLVSIIMSWDSVKAFGDDCSAKLVDYVWKRCGRFVASVVPCLKNLWASVKGYFRGLWARVTVYVRGRFGVVNPTYTEEEVELPSLDRDVYVSPYFIMHYIWAQANI